MKSKQRTMEELIDENNVLQKKLYELEIQIDNANKEITLLKENENRFIELAETIPAAIHVLQGENFRYINSTFERMTGYSKEECLSMNFWDVIHPDYKELVKHRGLVRQQGENPVSRYEFKILSKDDREVWADHSAGRIMLEGQPAVIAVLYDITDRKQNEEKLLQQHEILQETYVELEEIYSELQSSQGNLLEANAKLRQSEERLELALWATDEGLWDWDMLTGDLYFSYRWANMLGYSAEELKPHISSWEMRVHPEDMPAVQEKLQSHIEGKVKYYESEHRIKNKTGEWIWVFDRGKVVSEDKDGRPKRMVGTKRDITLQEEMKAALQKSENRYRTLVEAIPEIVAHVDLKGNYIWVNESGKIFFGDDVCKHHFRDYLVNPQDYPQTSRMVARLLKSTEGAYTVETLVNRRDGKARLLRWQSKALKEDGRIIGTLSTARDVTEIRDAQARLQTSEKRYRELFENSPIGLMKIDCLGNIIDINKYYQYVTGAPSKEAITCLNLFTEAYHRLDILNEVAQALACFEKGQSFSVELAYVTNWGKHLYMRYKMDPVFDNNGTILEAIVACEEISESKKAEEKIRYLSYNDALTGVYNRAFFDEELQRLNVPRQLPLSIIIGDINGLKLVNDAFGHQSGDKLLKSIAQILKNACRTEDIIARWGGDEFVILLPQTPPNIAYSICERIRIACQASNSDPIHLSIALGAASKQHPDDDIYKIISEAEDIMYRNKLLESKSIRNSIISSLETTLHEKTFETREHAQRLQKACIQFGKALGLPGNELDRLVLLANLHDIGKIGIPDTILSKPGPLLNEEWDIIKKHPEIGYRIVYSSHELIAIAAEVLAHHEKWDGSGYPEGLAGNSIPLLSRILAIVDAYDVMTHERSYKKAISHEQAMEEIRRCTASQFDPELVEVFFDIYK